MAIGFEVGGAGGECVGVEGRGEFGGGFAGDDSGEFRVVGGFDKNGGDVLCADGFDDGGNLPRGGFGVVVGSLNGEDAEIVGAGEVGEGVVGGDEGAVLRGNFGEGFACELVELAELADIVGGALIDGGSLLREDCLKSVADIFGVADGVEGILPCVGIGFAVVVEDGSDAVGGGENFCAGAGALGEFGELGFKVESVLDNEGCLGDGPEVGGADFVGVRVGTGREETVGADAAGDGNLPDEVVENGVGGDDEGRGGKG